MFIKTLLKQWQWALLKFSFHVPARVVVAVPGVSRNAGWVPRGENLGQRAAVWGVRPALSSAELERGRESWSQAGTSPRCCAGNSWRLRSTKHLSTCCTPGVQGLPGGSISSSTSGTCSSALLNWDPAPGMLELHQQASAFGYLLYDEFFSQRDKIRKC